LPLYFQFEEKVKKVLQKFSKKVVAKRVVAKRVWKRKKKRIEKNKLKLKINFNTPAGKQVKQWQCL